MSTRYQRSAQLLLMRNTVPWYERRESALLRRVRLPSSTPSLSPTSATIPDEATRMSLGWNFQESIHLIGTGFWAVALAIRSFVLLAVHPRCLSRMGSHLTYLEPPLGRYPSFRALSSGSLVCCTDRTSKAHHILMRVPFVRCLLVKFHKSSMQSELLPLSSCLGERAASTGQHAYTPTERPVGMMFLGSTKIDESYSV